MHDTEFGSARKHYFQLFEGQVVRVSDLIVSKYPMKRVNVHIKQSFISSKQLF